MKNAMHGTAVILAAGSGKRMGTGTHKQYLNLCGHPVLYYSLKTFQESPFIQDIVLVTGAGEEENVREQIVDPGGFAKVSRIVAGGSERYLSVWNALQVIEPEGTVYIHDAARPLVDAGVIGRAFACVQTCGACAAGMPSKDTVKITDAEGMVCETPRRDRVWIVQTPQVFDAALIREAYGKLMAMSPEKRPPVTDDAMVVETMCSHPVKMVWGSYENIKITTPEDMQTAEMWLKNRPAVGI